MGNYFSKEEDIKYTPLHHCVICDNVDAAGSLRWKGYTVHDKDSRGETVYELCKRLGSEDMKKMLGIV